MRPIWHGKEPPASRLLRCNSLFPPEQGACQTAAALPAEKEARPSAPRRKRPQQKGGGVTCEGNASFVQRPPEGNLSAGEAYASFVQRSPSDSEGEMDASFVQRMPSDSEKRAEWIPPRKALRPSAPRRKGPQQEGWVGGQNDRGGVAPVHASARRSALAQSVRAAPTPKAKCIPPHAKALRKGNIPAKAQRMPHGALGDRRALPCTMSGGWANSWGVWPRPRVSAAERLARMRRAHAKGKMSPPT